MSNRRWYQTVVNPCHCVLTRGAVPNPVSVSLKLNRMITKIGKQRYKMNANVYVGSRNRVHRRRGFRIRPRSAVIGASRSRATALTS
jgi:hypothetical protein